MSNTQRMYVTAAGVVSLAVLAAWYRRRYLRAQASYGGVSRAEEQRKHQTQSQEELSNAIWGSGFVHAAEYVRENAGKLTNDQLLVLYGLFKQSTEGPCNTKQPSILNHEARLKWDAWNKLGDLPIDEARVQYEEYVTTLFPNWLDADGEDDDGGGVGTGFGPVFSSLSDAVGEVDPRLENSIHSLVKRGETARVQEWLVSGAAVDETDEEGRTALHWAADSGHFHLVDLLVASGASVNAQDSEGMTALHCAAVCEYEKICERLISAGADVSLEDEEGETPSDLFPEGWTLTSRNVPSDFD